MRYTENAFLNLKGNGLSLQIDWMGGRLRETDYPEVITVMQGRGDEGAGGRKGGTPYTRYLPRFSFTLGWNLELAANIQAWFMAQTSTEN